MGAARTETTPYAGNAFDKYGSADPVVRRVMSGFFRALDDLWARATAPAPPGSLLDVGCGEGVITRAWAQRLSAARVVGLDVNDPRLRGWWERHARPNLEFVAGDVHDLPYADGEFDLVTSIEMLEQAGDPDRAVAELCRVAGRALILTVPREPIWRALNMASGRYLRELGNSPGTCNHWSRRGFVELVGRHATVEAVRTPLPWTLVLARP
jgi:ubiquinone/menaquinone biosynthesis C-methylase UbiE